MPKGKIQFPERDPELIERRKRGESWCTISHGMNIGKTAVRDRATRLGLTTPKSEQPPKVKPMREGVKDTLPPLPSLLMPMPTIRGL